MSLYFKKELTHCRAPPAPPTFYGNRIRNSGKRGDTHGTLEDRRNI